ncbi:MAG TPA: hypothetical protein VMG58_15300 [Candidatus Sulfotelmatobacter sp.]|nr:hypothetical protein [Candidatus Sulfotelmatobacter sp.]
MTMSPEQVLDALLEKAEAGELPAKMVGTLRHLAERLAAGQVMSEMQAELVRDFGAQHGIG